MSPAAFVLLEIAVNDSMVTIGYRVEARSLLGTRALNQVRPKRVKVNQKKMASRALGDCGCPIEDQTDAANHNPLFEIRHRTSALNPLEAAMGLAPAHQPSRKAAKIAGKNRGPRALTAA